MFPLPPLHNAVRTAAVVGKAYKLTKTAGINHLAIGYGHSHGNYYYLFMSKGSCCGYDKKRPAPGKEYRILACRSSNATGSFVDKDGVDCKKGGGTVVLKSHDIVYGPGGQGVYNDPKHGPILYYHYVDTTIGYADGQKRFGWNKINFSSGWPVV